MLLLVVAILSCAAAAWTWPWLRMCWKARSLPGPSFWWLLTSVQEYHRGLEYAFNLFGNRFAKHGPRFKMLLGPELLVSVASVVDAQSILSHPAVVDRAYLLRKAFERIAGVNVITAGGDNAHVRRRLVAPAFHASRLSDYVTDFARNADQMCARIAKNADGRTVDIKNEMSKCALGAIYETVIGAHINNSQQLTKARDRLVTGTDLIQRRITHPWLMVEWIYSLTADGKASAAAKQSLIDMFRDALTGHNDHYPPDITADPRRQPRRKARSFFDSAFDVTTGVPALTEAETFEEFVGLALAGTDTTANMMSYTLMLLGIHTDYQQIVVEEQRAIFGDSLRPATAEDVSQMSILELVIKESMRLFPATSFLIRDIPVDIELADGNVLPAGALAMVSVFHLHRSPDYFEEPDRFWPERFLAENSVGRHAFAYLPFGGGARKCLGYKYAMLQMKVTLSRMLREFSVGCRHTMRDLDRVEMGPVTKSVVGFDVQLNFRRGLLDTSGLRENGDRHDSEGVSEM